MASLDLRAPSKPKELNLSQAPFKKKARVERKQVSQAKVYWRTPGFDAFSEKQTTPKPGKWVACSEAISPETGIHSREWAASITKQSKNAFLIHLPYELRQNIWRLVFDDYSYDDHPLRPYKKKSWFRASMWPDSSRESLQLPLTCRQLYVDVVGAGLLYRHKVFSFTQTLLTNYISVINPAHKDMLRSVSFEIRVPRSSEFFPPKNSFDMLAGLRGLKHLTIEIFMDRIQCQLHDLRPAKQIVYHNGLPVPLHILEKLSDCEALKSIKNLHSFDFIFTMIYMAGRWPRETYAQCRLDNVAFDVAAGNNPKGPYGELEDHIRLHVLSPGIAAQSNV